ncbi:MAG: aminotransferase class V-fold PLP-dependent enzyme [Gammaproteobacteria bacterium]|nr:MAG: aminotransferase class V-fold PLP-dependent enzyme [Gammaproteobacteria bacterium]
MTPESAADEFPLDPALCHLNHAGVAPWPRRAVQAACDFATENMRQGSLDYPRWLRAEQDLRENLGQLLGVADTEGVALVPSTSAGLSLVAHGLSWQAGDEIVIPAGEFPSNRIVWDALATRHDVRLVEVAPGRDPEASLIAAMNRRTRLLSVSAIDYATGLRLDLERLGQACRQREILFCVDAIQQLGALPFDAEACQADFVAADGHKWLLGPEGLGVFWCHPKRLDLLQLNQHGWHMVEQMGHFEAPDWTPARSARRFEPGSPNMTGIHALRASTGLLLETGMTEVAAALRSRRQYLEAGLEQLGMAIHSPRDTARDSGILVFSHPRIDATDLYSRLMDARVLCARRGRGVRFSPHFYTPFDTLDRALEHVGEILASTD